MRYIEIDSPKQLKTQEVKVQLKKLMQQTLREALEAELEEFLGYPKYRRTNSTDSRNSHTQKRVASESGELEIKVPRDRNSEFEPQVVKKPQVVLEDLQDKIIALQAKGITTRDIQEIVEDMNGVELSALLISRLTDRIVPRLEEWQSRPLREVYTIIWLDCIFCRVREENGTEYKQSCLCRNRTKHRWDEGDTGILDKPEGKQQFLGRST